MARRRLDAVVDVWLPPAWFLGLYETMLGSARPEFHALAARRCGARSASVVGFTWPATCSVTGGMYGACSRPRAPGSARLQRQRRRHGPSGACVVRRVDGAVRSCLRSSVPSARSS